MLIQLRRDSFAALSICLNLCTMTTAIAQPDQFNYDESNVPSYTLPDPLQLAEGQSVDAATWRNSRRGEILQLFKQHVYGVQPPPPNDMTWKVFEQSATAIDGKATRKQVKLFITGEQSGPTLDLLMYVPNHRTAACRTFVGLNFRGNHTIQPDPAIAICAGCEEQADGGDDDRPSPPSRGSQADRWPVEMIIDRGFGVATIFCGDIDPDVHDEFQNVIHALYPELQNRGDNFATISAWAWGLSRAMDYFEHDDDVDHGRVAVIGHSRLGKTALWAGATDPRFAMVVSNNAGCGGAALARRRFGETVQRINNVFPHWFCDNHKEYNDKEDAPPGRPARTYRPNRAAAGIRRQCLGRSMGRPARRVSGGEARVAGVRSAGTTRHLHECSVAQPRWAPARRRRGLPPPRRKTRRHRIRLEPLPQIRRPAFELSRA